MSAEQQAGALAARMKRAEDGTAWAKIPPPGGARGSRWEVAIIELAEAGEPRFVKILAEHVARGVIVSPRASAACSWPNCQVRCRALRSAPSAAAPCR